MPHRDLVVHSGGQTGVDRAALDAALAAGVPVGGWCPHGRRAEDGPIPLRYPLRETISEDYAERTRWNVRDTDATLVLTRAMPVDGTVLTVDVAKAMGRPLLILDLGARPKVTAAVAWLHAHEVQALNIAGPRESSVPGVYAEARAFIAELLEVLGY